MISVSIGLSHGLWQMSRSWTLEYRNYEQPNRKRAVDKSVNAEVPGKGKDLSEVKGKRLHEKQRGNNRETKAAQ